MQTSNKNLRRVFAVMYDKIDKKYSIPVELISCPGCGLRYGHHRTKVDVISQECSECVKKRGFKDTDFVSAKYFIENVLDFHPIEELLFAKKIIGV